MEKSSGVEARIEVKPSFGLADDEIADMLKASVANAKEDMQARMLKEQQVEASRVIESVNAALQADSRLLSQDEIADIEAGLRDLAQTSQGTNPDDIEQAIEKVNHLTAAFAERRMDASINQALSGQAVDKI